MLPILVALLLAAPKNPETLSSFLVSHADVAPYDFTSTTSTRAYIEHATTTPDRALYIAEHESDFVRNARGDKDITCNNSKSVYYGKPVYARGVWQITRCWHPEVSDEQADDVEWSTAWALPLVANPKTCRAEWTTCRAFFTERESAR